MRPELRAEKELVDEQLNSLDSTERGEWAWEDLEEVRSRTLTRLALVAKRTFLEGLIDKEYERDRVDAEMRARHEAEDKAEAAEAARANERRRSEDKPREVSGFPGPGTWPTDVRR